jgi:hypothetical protein
MNRLGKGLSNQGTTVMRLVTRMDMCRSSLFAARCPPSSRPNTNPALLILSLGKHTIGTFFETNGAKTKAFHALRLQYGSQVKK